MMNTGFSIEALRATTPAAPAAKDSDPPADAAKRAAEPTDPDWAAAAAFLSRCQNLPDPAAKDKPVSKRPQDVGGLFYQPERGMAKGELDENGQQIWFSYGNATALGLACFLESNLNRDDRRVTGCVDWLRSSFNIEEHPGGLGKEGYYFYLHTLSRALALYGEEPLKGLDGKPPIAWRRDLMIKIVSLQRVDEKTGYAYWVNDAGRWMENDPVLVTSYCCLALETLVNEPSVPSRN
jgi:squalene-hopene/tetraprenyl-beta-curcumene cyclase